MLACWALALPSGVSVKGHRSREVTQQLQREHPCPSTGRTSGACPGYRKDHILPLACGSWDATAGICTSMATWLDWQKPYRLGVILVLPPEPVRSQINVLRAKYDPQSHKNVEAHISLTVPLQKEPDDHEWAEFERIALRFQAFPIGYEPLVPFLLRPGAALDIQRRDWRCRGCAGYSD